MKPLFISVEAECYGRERWTELRSLETLDLLQTLGYKRFKLIDQPSLAVLKRSGCFYFRASCDMATHSAALQGFPPIVSITQALLQKLIAHRFLRRPAITSTET